MGSSEYGELEDKIRSLKKQNEATIKRAKEVEQEISSLERELELKRLPERMTGYCAAQKKSESGRQVVLNVREEVKEIIEQEVGKIDFEKLAKKYVKKKYRISPEEWFWVAYGIVFMVNKK